MNTLLHFLLLCESGRSLRNVYFCGRILGLIQGFLRCFRDPIWVPRIREKCRRAPRIKENRVPRIRESESLQDHTGYLTVSLKKPWLDQKCLSRLAEYDDVIREPPF